MQVLNRYKISTTKARKSKLTLHPKDSTKPPELPSTSVILTTSKETQEIDAAANKIVEEIDKLAKENRVIILLLYLLYVAHPTYGIIVSNDTIPVWSYFLWFCTRDRTLGSLWVSAWKFLFLRAIWKRFLFVTSQLIIDYSYRKCSRHVHCKCQVCFFWFDKT